MAHPQKPGNSQGSAAVYRPHRAMARVDCLAEHRLCLALLCERAVLAIPRATPSDRLHLAAAADFPPDAVPVAPALEPLPGLGHPSDEASARPRRQSSPGIPLVAPLGWHAAHLFRHVPGAPAAIFPA